MRISIAMFPLFIAAAMAGCGGGPTAPSVSASGALPDPTAPREFALFVDRDTGVATTDVRDAHEQIVRFSTDGQLIWMSSGARFDGFLADGQVVTAGPVCADCYFLVRFATRGGQRRAYLTWAGDPGPDRPTTILDLDVVGDRLLVEDTDVMLIESSDRQD
jgi:hypothetical protein